METNTSNYTDFTTLTTTTATEIAVVTSLTKSLTKSLTTSMTTTMMTSVSPFNLSHDMSKVVRLLLFAGIGVVGSVGNIFMISSVVIEDNLNKRGNAFLVNSALADLLVTGIIIPASAVIILAGFQDSPSVCNFQWFLVIVCCYVSVLTVATTAAENFARLCLSQECYSILTPTRITITLLAIWILSSLAVALQYIYHIGPDYCSREFSGLNPRQVIIAGSCFALPLLASLFVYIRIVMCVRFAKTRPTFKPPTEFVRDFALMNTNFTSLLLFTVFWSPLVIVVGLSVMHEIPDRLFDNVTSLALSKSWINCFLYCFMNRHFRNAYVNLFHYCCCKTTVSLTRRTRGEPTRPSVDVRVHIIPGYNMYSYTSPQRANREAKATSSSNVQKRFAGSSRPTTSRTPSREVYEL